MKHLKLYENYENKSINQWVRTSLGSELENEFDVSSTKIYSPNLITEHIIYDNIGYRIWVEKQSTDILRLELSNYNKSIFETLYRATYQKNDFDELIKIAKDKIIEIEKNHQIEIKTKEFNL